MTISVMLWSLLICSSIFAQSYDPPFVSDNSGTLAYESGTGIYTDLTTADNISYTTWNADGTKLAFIKATHVPQNSDMREIGYIEFHADGTPTPPILLQSHLPAIGYNIAWMRDGRLMFIADHPKANPETGIIDKRDLWAVTVGENPELIGTFTPIGECGGGSGLPADWVYWQEIGGFGVTMLLVDTPYGILYSYSCSGSELALMNPTTGESRPFVSDLRSAVVSPDREYVAGVAYIYADNPLPPRLMIYTISTGEVREIPLTFDPTLVAWNMDGSALYYSTRSIFRNAIDTLNADQKTLFYQLIGYEMSDVPEYKVAIHQVHLDDGQTTLVYQGDGYIIGRIFESPTSVYISIVPNPMSWVDQILARQIAAGDVDANFDAVQVGVLRLDRQGDSFGEEVFLGFYEKFTPFIASVQTITS